MYCGYEWEYTGINFNNICCPNCKRRFNVLEGKARRFNEMAFKNYKQNLNVPKCYRVRKAYKKSNGVVQTYIQHYNELDQVYNSIVTLIDKGVGYTFKDDKIVIMNESGNTLTVDLYNESKPCIIPMKDLVSSYVNDPKYQDKMAV
jgi:hypothetical protein